MGDSELKASLEILKRYHISGLLQADLPHTGDMWQGYTIYIQLKQGELASLYLKDWQDDQIEIGQDELYRIEEESGPLDWHFLLTSESRTQRPPAITIHLHFPSFSESVVQTAIPATLLPIQLSFPLLDQSHLMGWTATQHHYLCTVFSLIDGKRTVQEIKMHTTLPASVVEETLLVLQALKVIRFL